MLSQFPVDVSLLVTDLDRAKAFYGDTLGLGIVMENADGVTFRCGGDSRLVVTKSMTGTADTQTQATWRVSDVAAEVAELESRGVKTDMYGMPGPVDGVADVGFAPAAWFVDPFKNSLSLIEIKRDER
jgi:catechol 2,3-dioxygenase-like lactoylglutathione lyase family enzyme